MSSSTQKIIEAQQLLAWGNRVAARRHLTLALQENPHDGQLWFWLAQTLDNQAHIINALERALKYDPGLLEAERYLDLLRKVMGKSQPAHTGRTAAFIPSPVSEPADGAEQKAHDQQAKADKPMATASATPSPQDRAPAYATSAPDSDLSPVTIDEALESSQIRSLEQEAATRPLPERAETGLTTKKLALQELLSESTTRVHGLSLSPDDQDQPLAQAKDQSPSAPSKADTPPSTEGKKRDKGWRGYLLRLFLLLLVLLGLCVCGWYIVSYNLLPRAAIESNPTIATQVATLQEVVPPFPTELALDPTLFSGESSEPEWLRQANSARYNNQIQEAEKILRTKLVEEPTNVIALLALSDLRRDQLNGEKEALQLAEQALAIINRQGTLEQRAEAAERYVWAMAQQSQPDVGLALARGEQAASETPDNAYAQWAYAMATTLQQDPSAAWKATEQASTLSADWQPNGLNEAKQAEIYARFGDLEQAIQRYEVALQKTDYVPWRVALVRLLQSEEKLEQAEQHIDYLRQIAPDDPAVQEL